MCAVFSLSSSLALFSFYHIQEIPSVTRKHQNFVVKCEAKNVVGLSAATVTLDVICMFSIVLFTHISSHSLTLPLSIALYINEYL